MGKTAGFCKKSPKVLRTGDFGKGPKAAAWIEKSLEDSSDILWRASHQDEGAFWCPLCFPGASPLPGIMEFRRAHKGSLQGLHGKLGAYFYNSVIISRAVAQGLRDQRVNSFAWYQLCSWFSRAKLLLNSLLLLLSRDCKSSPGARCGASWPQLYLELLLPSRHAGVTFNPGLPHNSFPALPQSPGRKAIVRFFI